MLLSADWVVPVAHRPIRDGAVLVRDGLVAAVGLAADLASECGSDERTHFEACVLAPGLVNAHTHLGLTGTAGLLEPEPFTQWMPKLVRAMRAWDAEDYRASAVVGARRCLECGVTAVGDIVYHASTIEPVLELGLGGTFFFEVLGIEPADLPGRLDSVGFVTASSSEQPRARVGLSPHAVYSSSADLIRSVALLARDLGVPVAMHLAESPDEVDFVRSGTGPLRRVADRLAPGFQAQDRSPVAYVDSLGALEGMTAVHLSQATPSDVRRLAAAARGAVTCPRSNAWLSTGTAPVARMLESGMAVGVGTDSLASNADLDLMCEVRAVAASAPQVPAATLVAMATHHGAVALGLETRFGSLLRGAQADVVAFRTGETSDPEHALVQAAGAASVEAVMSAGEWRVIGGRSLMDTSEAEARVTEAAARAREALAAS